MSIPTVQQVEQTVAEGKQLVLQAESLWTSATKFFGQTSAVVAIVWGMIAGGAISVPEKPARPAPVEKPAPAPTPTTTQISPNGVDQTPVPIKSLALPQNAADNARVADYLRQTLSGLQWAANQLDPKDGK